MNTLKSSLAAGAIALAVAAPASAGVQVLGEGFGNVGGLPGWTLLNNSNPAGSSWFQGNAGVFGAHSGAADSYAAASFLGAGDPAGVVDNWLITPLLSLNGLTSLSFWSRHENVPGFADTLEVRYASGNGSGTADFTTLLGTIGGAAGYPADWTEWSTSLNLEGQGRFAFRYVGYAGDLNYIGLDTVRVVTAVPEPSLYAMLALGLGLGALGFARRKSN